MCQIWMCYQRSWRKSQMVGICPDYAIAYTVSVAGLSLMHEDKLAELYACCSTATFILIATKNRKEIKEL